MVVHKLTMDLLGHKNTNWVEVIQGDCSSRSLEIALYAGKCPWEIPESVRVLIRYRKHNGKWGEYDTLPDGTQAWACAGNVLTLWLAPQVTEASGTVLLSAMILKEDKILNTCSVEVRVKPSLKGGELFSRENGGNYRNITGFVPAPDSGQVGQYLQIASVDRQGHITGTKAVELSGSEGSGTAGGYYTPTVSQVDETTVEISYKASADTMEKIPAQTITLPSGTGEDLLNEEGVLRKSVLPEGYPYEAEEVILQETQLSGESEYELPERISLTEGAKYTVMWNGTQYICTAQAYEADGIAYVTLGNLGVVTDNGNTGEPFLIFPVPDALAEAAGEITVVYILDGVADVTLSIKGPVRTPIDKKWLPEGYPYIQEAGLVVLEETDFKVQETVLDISGIAVGGTYKVIWNGTAYSCKAANIMLAEYACITIGNTKLVGSGENTGEPFLIAYVSGSWFVMASTDGTTGTVSIITERSYIPFDEQYLPAAMRLNLYSGQSSGSLRIARAAEETDTYHLGIDSVALGRDSKVPGNYSLAEGFCTVAASDMQHVQGWYNLTDYDGKYAHIVGNGFGDLYRSNAHTLDWDGVGWFAGGLQVGGNGQDDGAKTVLLEGDTAPNPNALTFSGAVTGAYDGSAALNVEIPSGSGESVPDYVRTEAESVARTVNLHQSSDSIVFPFLADAHCGYYTDTENAAATLAGQLLALIGRRVPYDFVVNGGDMANGAWDTTKDLTFTQYEDYTELTAEGQRGIPAVWVPGNHDDAPYIATDNRVNQKELFALVGRKSRIGGAACPNGCNYGYLDLENRKLRVICLDTDDKRSWGTVAVGNGEEAPAYLNAHNLSGAQLQWLASTALDFSGKENPAQWAVVVVSHVALNVSGTITDAVSAEAYAYSTENAAVILGAYKDGSSGSISHNDVTVSYDFTSDQSRASVLCAVHGHNHKFCSETLTGGILSIGCPNVMNGRERASDDGNTYSKTADTAQGTSFCILTIDRETKMIYADCAGAGYDRAFSYSGEEAAYTNQLPASTDTDGTIYNGTGYAEGYYLSSGTLASASGSYVSGFIPCKIADVLYFENCQIVTATDKHRFSLYDSDKNHLATIKTTSTASLNQVYGEDGYLDSITIKANSAGSGNDDQIAYIRFCCSYIGADSVVTVNEPIV